MNECAPWSSQEAGLCTYRGHALMAHRPSDRHEAGTHAWLLTHTKRALADSLPVSLPLTDRCTLRAPPSCYLLCACGLKARCAMCDDPELAAGQGARSRARSGRARAAAGEPRQRVAERVQRDARGDARREQRGRRLYQVRHAEQLLGDRAVGERRAHGLHEVPAQHRPAQSAVLTSEFLSHQSRRVLRSESPAAHQEQNSSTLQQTLQTCQKVMLPVWHKQGASRCETAFCSWRRSYASCTPFYAYP